MASNIFALIPLKHLNARIFPQSQWAGCDLWGCCCARWLTSSRAHLGPACFAFPGSGCACEKTISQLLLGWGVSEIPASALRALCRQLGWLWQCLKQISSPRCLSLFNTKLTCKHWSIPMYCTFCIFWIVVFHLLWPSAAHLLQLGWDGSAFSSVCKRLQCYTTAVARGQTSGSVIVRDFQTSGHLLLYF